MRRPRTKKQADRATDARIQKAYGITLEERDKLDDSNDEKCWICGRPPVNVRLSVDHDHAWKKVKVESHQFKPVGTFGGAAGGQKLWWISSAIYNGMLYQIEAPKKAEAVRVVKKKLKRASVRGLLCQFCNRDRKSVV